MGDAAFEFIIRPYKDTKVIFESRKFLKSFLAVDQNAQVSVEQMLPDFSEVQVEWFSIEYVFGSTETILAIYTLKAKI